MNPFGGIYRERRVLVTGHTGFKGSWLALWLTELGARVSGVALAPWTSPNHWDLLDLQTEDLRMDVRDAAGVGAAVKRMQPEVVFHLAAQPLVRRSYRDPLETWSSNVMGTANVLEACRATPSVRAIVVVTTDKCYRNNDWPWGYRETDTLGGHDPYSASKAAAELVVSSFRSSYFEGHDGPLVATARAGNVIGGGDWSEDRLVPDLVRAVVRGESLEIRSPDATRPWQHVLESLSGYLLLGQRLLERRPGTADAWNFGPEPEGNRSVVQVLGCLQRHWPRLQWHITSQPQPHEARLLYLDSAKARCELGWSTVWGLEPAIERTAAWYRALLDDRRVDSRAQLHAYMAAAASRGIAWATP